MAAEHHNLLWVILFETLAEGICQRVLHLRAEHYSRIFRAFDNFMLLHTVFEILPDVAFRENLWLVTIWPIVHALEGHFLQAELLLDREGLKATIFTVCLSRQLVLLIGEEP